MTYRFAGGMRNVYDFSSLSTLSAGGPAGWMSGSNGANQQQLLAEETLNGTASGFCP
ncbi:MAG: hypothetical protein M3Z08_17705 [Chloroflexota bacterium]|nr:hypothetical protein [Chloroflexota bacterium]